jgi:hypothetical protein
VEGVVRVRAVEEGSTRSKDCVEVASTAVRLGCCRLKINWKKNKKFDEILILQVCEM